MFQQVFHAVGGNRLLGSRYFHLGTAVSFEPSPPNSASCRPVRLIETEQTMQVNSPRLVASLDEKYTQPVSFFANRSKKTETGSICAVFRSIFSE